MDAFIMTTGSTTSSTSWSKFLTAHILLAVSDLIKTLGEDACRCGATTN